MHHLIEFNGFLFNEFYMGQANVRHFFIGFIAALAIPAAFLPVLADSAYLVQLGSFQTREEAQSAWQDYLKEYSTQLADVNQYIANINLPNSTLFRLQAGPISGRNQAKALCEALKPKLESCLLVETAMIDSLKSERILPANTSSTLGNELKIAGIETSKPEIPQVESIIKSDMSAAPVVAVAATTTEAIAQAKETVVETASTEAATTAPAVDAAKDAWNQVEDTSKTAPSVALNAPTANAEEVAKENSKMAEPVAIASAPAPAPVALASSSGTLGRLILNADGTPKGVSETPRLAAATPLQDDKTGRVEVKEAVRVAATNMDSQAETPMVSNSEWKDTESKDALVLPNAEIKKIAVVEKSTPEIADEPNAEGEQYVVKISPYPSQSSAFNNWEVLKTHHSAYKKLKVTVLAPVERNPEYTIKAGKLNNKANAEALCQLAKEDSKICSIVTVKGESAVKATDASNVVEKSPLVADVKAFNENVQTPEPVKEVLQPRRLAVANENKAEALERTSGEQIFWVQMGNYDSENAANVAWEDHVTKHPEVFAGLSPRVSTPSRSASPKANYRLRTGSFNNRLDALNFCTKLQGLGIKCLVISQY